MTQDGRQAVAWIVLEGDESLIRSSGYDPEKCSQFSDNISIKGLPT